MKERILKCPLCDSDKYEKKREIDINKLIEMWVSKRGFNPIPEIYNNEILERRYCNNCGLFYYNYHLHDSKKLYEELERVSGYYPNFRPTYEIAKKAINKIKPQEILEIGCGNGSFLEYIKDTSLSIIGNEYNNRAIELCLKKGLNVISTPIEDIDQRFEVICNHEVLEHIFNTKSFINNCVKLLKKGGKLIIGTPDPESILKINGISELHYPPHHQFDFSKKTFEWIANKYDLKIYDYQKTQVEKRHFEKYLDITNDNITYEECNKKFSGHSHVIIFEKK